MILIIIYPDRFTVTGHAGHDPPAHDIVCAGVSTLVQTFVASMEALTDAKVNSNLSSGRATVKYGNPSERVKLLADSFLIGMRGIAGAYPGCVQVAEVLVDIVPKP